MNATQSKIALVTGASRGIGLAIALELAKRGLQVVATGTRESSVAKINAAFAEQNLQVSALELDVTNAESIQALLAKINEIYASGVDILVNNAGVTADNLLMRMSDEEWDKVINTNLTSVFHLCKAVIRSMLKKRWGRIINIASVVANIGNVGQTNYSASKGGVISFTKSLAKEVASRNVTVNAVAPGYIETDMTGAIPDDIKPKLLETIPLGRIGKPADIAKAVAFLASDDAEYITGHVLQVNGGMVMY